MSQLQLAFYFILLPTFLFCGPENSYSWEKFRGDYQNSGNLKIEVKNLIKHDQSRALQKFVTRGLVWASPIIDNDGNIYVGSADKNFYAFSPEGREIWRYTILDKSDSLIDSAATLTKDQKLVVVPGGDGVLHALDRLTGKLIWSFHARHASDSSHSSGEIVNSFEGNVTYNPTNNMIYAGSDNGNFYGVDGDSGIERFSYKTDMMIWSVPAFSDNKEDDWIAFGSLDGHLHLIDKNQGSLITKFKIGGEIKASPAYIPEKKSLVVGSSNGEFKSIQIEKKGSSYQTREIWSFSAEGEIYSSAAYQNGVIVFSDVKGNVYGLNYNGEKLWKFKTFKAILSSMAISRDGVVLFGGSNGHLYALDIKTGKRIWTYKVSEVAIKNNLDSSVVVSNDGMIYVGSYDGHIYGIPYEYCLTHPEDNRCDLSSDDVHNWPYLEGLDPYKNHLLIQDYNGHYHQGLNNVSPHEIVRLKFVAFEEGKFIDNAAIDPLSLKININGAPYSDYRVSGDGKFVNIISQNFWSENSCYDIQIQGRYYHKFHWAWDRLKWLFLPYFDVQTKFCTGSFSGSEASLLSNFSSPLNLHSFFVYGPTTLDTYIPAALDGQKFVATIFNINEQDKSFKAVLWPAHATEKGFKIYAEPLRSAILNGHYDHNGISLKSENLTIGAMGAVIPFKEVILAGTVKDKKIDDGLSYMEASCLNIKGNGNSYTFPMDFVTNTCDFLLRVQILGQFKGEFDSKLPLKPDAYYSLIKVLGGGKLKLFLKRHLIPKGDDQENQDHDVVTIYIPGAKESLKIFSFPRSEKELKIEFDSDENSHQVVVFVNKWFFK